MGAPELSLAPYADFEAASRACLAYLQAQLGMGLWIVTRVAEDDWIVLSAKNRSPQYSVREGDVLRWSDSFCSRMVRGEGPNVAPNSVEVAAYHAAPIARQLPIGSYLGVPMYTVSGELFGTLCAIDPAPREDLSASAGPLLEVLGNMLATVLDRDLTLAAQRRRAEAAEVASMVDELTGLWNRRGWAHLCAAEERRARRYGHPACVLSVDLDGLKAANDALGHARGDEMLKQAAAALRLGVREHDVVARLGGDEFGVLLVECTEEQGLAAEARLRQTLEGSGVRASVGFAKRDPARSLDEAWEAADARMYEDKRARKARAAR